MIYTLGGWDAEDGKGYRAHILTDKDFEEYGVCWYDGYLYVESDMPEYIEDLAKRKQDLKGES